MAASNRKTSSRRPHNALPRRGKAFVPPPTITLPPMLKSGGDVAFRETLYLMFQAFGRLTSFRDGFVLHGRENRRGLFLGYGEPQFFRLEHNAVQSALFS